MVFFGLSLTFLITNLITDLEYKNNWLGVVYAGLIYSYFAALISSIPTILLGWPASLIAQKKNALNAKTIMPGAAILGSLYLSIFGSLLFKSLEVGVLFWLACIGFGGGLFNGYIFLKSLKPNKNRNEMDSSAELPIR